jgi:tRNA modification GTPase
LLNLFSQEDLAIVTNIPGTTRDPVRALININGIPIKVVDTAGIHETNDPVEKAGIDKSISIINTSSLALVIIDDLNDIDKYINYFLKLNQNVKLIWVFNKIDLIDKSPCVDLIGKHRVISISAKFNEGIGLLEKEILDVFGVQSMDSNESLYASRKRHILALNDIDRYLKSALNNLNQPELLAQDLLSAQNKLSSITGDFSPDDLLGEIFSRFCIGK